VGPPEELAACGNFRGRARWTVLLSKRIYSSQIGPRLAVSNNTSILGVLHDIFSAKLPSRPITLSETTTAADIRGWDSMAHVRLILAIEERLVSSSQTESLAK